MPLPSPLRKLALTAHIVFSVGWLGAIVPYLALAIAGLISSDAQLVRAAYLSMKLIGWFVIVPLSLAALLSGLIQSLGTAWGLFRHWWVVAKLLLTTTAVIILIVHMQVVNRMAGFAAEATLAGTDFRPLRIQLILHPAGGLLVLLAVTALSVFKPWGLTFFGSRLASPIMSYPANKTGAEREPTLVLNRPRWGRVFGIHAAVLLLLFVILHIAGGGLRHH